MDKIFLKKKLNKEGVSIIIEKAILTIIVAILVDIQVATKQTSVANKPLIPSIPDTSIIIGRRHGN